MSSQSKFVKSAEGQRPEWQSLGAAALAVVGEVARKAAADRKQRQ